MDVRLVQMVVKILYVEYNVIVLNTGIKKKRKGN